MHCRLGYSNISSMLALGSPPQLVETELADGVAPAVGEQKAFTNALSASCS